MRAPPDHQLDFAPSALGREALARKAEALRNEVIEVAVRNGAGHLAPSLSCVEILVALYYAALRYRPHDPLWEDRDRLVFSKAHGSYALYAILADLGVIPLQQWKAFYTAGSTLSGCVERRPEYGLEAGCGALGHGLPLATGLAFGAKLQGKSYRTFCVVGDGELQEGTTWEAVQFAVKHELNNLVIIVDRNRLQAMDFVENILDRGPSDLLRRLQGFGLSPRVAPGHEAGVLAGLFATQLEDKTPGVVIAETVKGFGLPCMENVPKFHFRIPTPQELALKSRTTGRS